MLQKLIVTLLLTILIATPVVLANIEVLSTQDLSFDCDAMVVEEKNYLAKSNEIDVGLWCSENANVLLYECHDLNCEDKTYLTFGSKVNGILTKMVGFDVGARYNYECYECPVDPTLSLEYGSLTINEGETFELTVSCIDSKGRVGSLQFEGWLKTNHKITSYDDAGEYSTRITCEDQNGLSVTEELIVTVEDVNRPPVVHTVLRE